MKLGFSPATALMFDLDAAFKLAVELKLDFIELNGDLQEIEPLAQPTKKVRELTHASGLGLTLHLPYIDLNLTSLIPAARRTSVERVARSLEYGAEVGASCGVLHTGMHYYRHPMIDPRASQALNESLEALRDPPIPVALENLALTDYDFIREPEGLEAVTKRFSCHNCLDFGHAHLETQQAWRDEAKRGEDLITRYQQTLQERIVHLHLHNNDGSSDQHRPTPAGSLDYTRYREFLASFGGTVCLEIAGGEAGIRASVQHMRDLVGPDAHSS